MAHASLKKNLPRPILARPIIALAVIAALSATPAWAPPASAQGGGFTMFMSPEQEKQVGAEEHPKILSRFGGEYDETGLNDYVAGIGQRLLGQAPDGNEYRFTLLNTPMVNAFALPGGYVYVTRGIMALANNEAELAGVLAHEIGHVKARHSAQRYSKSVAFSLGALALGALFKSEALSNVAGVGGELYLRSFSRDQEFEADNLGVKYLSESGYPTIAMAAFLESLNQNSQFEARSAGKDQQAGADFFSTHPRTVDRVNRAVNAAGPGAAQPYFGRDDYLDRIDGMLYDDDPAQGFVRGNRFVHPEMKFGFEVPADFKMTNTSTAVVAQGPSGALIQLDQEQDREKRDAARNLTDYLTRIWAKDLRLSGVESIDVNGLDSVTGRTKIKGKNGMVDVRLVAIDFEDDMIFRFTMLTPPELTKRLDPEMRKTARSFHRLGRNEASEVKPLRLEIAPVRRGDTEKRFSAMMALPDDDASQALEKFRVLNGLRNDESIAPGQRVKIVRDEGAGRSNDYDSDDYRSWR